MDCRGTLRPREVLLQVYERSKPQADGKLVYVVYKVAEESTGGFGSGGWEEGWRERLRWKHR